MSATPPTDVILATGHSLGGRYQIDALLGRGGMSRVYKAVQAPLGRAVAVKVLKDDPEDPSLKRRFLFEASITARLTHPNTITIFDYGADHGMLYFAMELLNGSTLSEVMKREGRFSEERTLHIARQVCRSLRQAHAMGLVHRDLKPSNLFLLDHGDDPDFVKVLDFGLVKLFGKQDEMAEHLTPGGSLIGTPHYMAPEQARGKECDERADIYSLGAVLFQMLSGRVPYEGTSAVDVLVRHATEPVPILREAFPGLEVSAELEAAVARCLAKKPEDRFRNMDDVLTALPGDRPSGSRPPPLPPGWDAPEDAPAVEAPGAGAQASLEPAAKPEPPAMPGPRESRAHAVTPPVVGTRRLSSRSAAESEPAPAPAPRPARRKGLLVVAAVLAVAAIAGAVAWLHPRERPDAGPPAPVAALAPAPAAAPSPAPAPASGSPAAAPAAANPTEAAPAAAPPAGVPVVAAAPSGAPAVAILAGAAAAAPRPAAGAAGAPPSTAAGESEKHPARRDGAQPAKHDAAQPAAAKQQAKAPLTPAAPEVIDGLNERLGRAVSGIRQCAMIENLRGGPGSIEGTLELTVTVDPLGHLGDVAIGRKGLSKTMESCVRGAVKRVKFDRFEGPSVTLKRSVSLAVGG